MHLFFSNPEVLPRACAHDVMVATKAERECPEDRIQSKYLEDLSHTNYESEEEIINPD